MNKTANKAKGKMNRKDYDRWTTNGKDIVVIKTSKENKTNKKGNK